MIAMQEFVNSAENSHWGTAILTVVVAPALVSWGTSFLTSKRQVENQVARLEAQMESLQESNNRILDVLLKRHDHR